jgi:PAS domain-containing protein
MSIVTDRIYEDASGVAACARCPDAAAKSYLVEALGTTLDSIDVGVIIVNGEARILHANQAAKRMLDQRSPIVSLGGCLGTLRADLTKELRTLQPPKSRMLISVPSASASSSWTKK